MGATSKGGSEAFEAFAKFIRANTSQLRVRPPGVPILYAGFDRGTAIYKRIAAKQAEWAKKNKVAGKFVVITDVLLKMDSPVPGYASMLAFAENAARTKGGLTGDEYQDVWDLLSAFWAQQNAKSIFVWKGETLQSDPVLTAIELPVLIFSKNIRDKKSNLVKNILRNQKNMEEELKNIDDDFQKQLLNLTKSVKERTRVIKLYKLGCSLQKMSS